MKRTRRRSTQLFVAALALIFLLGPLCQGPARQSYPTGVERREIPGGVLITATGRASANAIEKNSGAMMTTTSREAARLLLEHELGKSEYKGGTITQKGAEFLADGEYCRLVVEFQRGEKK
ncbi:MAG: hypothetical protein HY042_04560 [Spirochaetia bacterium]|nr:hypothetical protein [Spirochaetia bacterium]